MRATPEIFRMLGENMLGINHARVDSEKLKEHASMFGVSPPVVAEVWDRINPVANVHQQSEHKHLLWAMLFLKKFHDDLSLCKIVGAKDPKWHRKWCYLFVDAIAALDGQVIRWNNRFVNWNHQSNCLVWVDCTDCKIEDLQLLVLLLDCLLGGQLVAQLLLKLLYQMKIRFRQPCQP